MDAVVGLLPSAEAIATPAASAAEAALDRHDADARLRLASGPVEPSRANLDAANTLAEAEQAKMNHLNAKIASLNEAIGSLILARQERQRSIWGRWFPNVAADAELARLRKRHEELLRRHRSAEGPMLRAFAAQSRAEKQLAASLAASKASHGKAMAAVRIRVAAIARARRILTLWPSIAYAGVGRLLAVGVRMDKVRRRGWDTGPSRDRVRSRGT